MWCEITDPFLNFDGATLKLGNEWIIPTLYWECDYLSMGLKSIHVSERSPWCIHMNGTLKTHGVLSLGENEPANKIETNELPSSHECNWFNCFNDTNICVSRDMILVSLQSQWWWLLITWYLLGAKASTIAIVTRVGLWIPAKQYQTCGAMIRREK